MNLLMTEQMNTSSNVPAEADTQRQSGEQACPQEACPSPLGASGACRCACPITAGGQEQAGVKQTGAAGGKVVVRYGRMKQLGLFTHDLDTPPALGMKLVVHTERGTEMGTVVINVAGNSSRNIEDGQLRQYIADCGKDYPFTRGGKVIRPANHQDINDQCHLDKSAIDEAGFCLEQIKALSLDMRLVAVEHILGGERAVFFFMSETRVDFRELVRRLATQYHTRIEMYQIGARDEARLLADYERCGRQCCCREYLKLLKPISMRMAKVQKATLDPAKISGRCGRLMCCLRYEDKSYEELRRKLPKRSTWVRTAKGVVGKVLETQIITQLVRLEQVDNRQIVVSNEEIVERGMTSPPETPAHVKTERLIETEQPFVEVEPEPLRELLYDEEPYNDSEAETEAEVQTAPGQAPGAAEEHAMPMSQKPPSGTGRRRRKSRRRGQKPKHPGALSVAPRVHDDANAGRRGKKRRRRRKPGNNNPENSD